jgi:hypothetical protein
MGSPILPRNEHDPTGQDRRIRSAMKSMSRRVREVRKAYREKALKTPYEIITVNSGNIYRYELSPAILAGMISELEQLVDRLMLEGGADRLWFAQQYVIPAYEQGTAQSWANLGAQSVEYARTRSGIESVVFSEPYQTRIAYVRARQFEEMKGLTADMKKSMGRILADGLAAGRNPRSIADALTTQAGVEERQAHRVARTEINNALRQARMDETEDAMVKFDLQSLELHISALSPTTRPTHEARHATLHTIAEQREWWSVDANAINCACSSLTVLVNKDGQPLNPNIIAKAKAMRGDDNG